MAFAHKRPATRLFCDGCPAVAVLQEAHGGAKCTTETAPLRIRATSCSSTTGRDRSKKSPVIISMGNIHESPASRTAPVRRPHPPKTSRKHPGRRRCGPQAARRRAFLAGVLNTGAGASGSEGPEKVDWSGGSSEKGRAGPDFGVGAWMAAAKAACESPQARAAPRWADRKSDRRRWSLRTTV